MSSAPSTAAADGSHPPPASLPKPHAFHLNLPPSFFDSNGVPLVTQFASEKAQQAIDLAS